MSVYDGTDTTQARVCVWVVHGNSEPPLCWPPRRLSLHVTPWWFLYILENVIETFANVWNHNPTSHRLSSDKLLWKTSTALLELGLF